MEITLEQAKEMLSVLSQMLIVEEDPKAIRDLKKDIASVRKLIDDFEKRG